MSSFYGNHGSIGSGDSLPSVQPTDEGKVLIVQNGEWVPGIVDANELPTVTENDNNKVLTVVNGEWIAAESVQFSGLQNFVDGTANGSVRSVLAVAEDENYTLGIGSVAEGSNTKAPSDYSHAEGSGTIASGDYSHAEGSGTTASGQSSHAEGSSTAASGAQSHAEGAGTTASGMQSHAEGSGTIANHKSQHVFGEYNVADTSTATANTRGTYVEIVGKGTSNNARSNARTLDWSGNEVLAGKLTVGAAPTGNMDVTTKQYVDTAVSNVGGLPSVTWVDNGKVLMVSGARWQAANPELGYSKSIVYGDVVYGVQTDTYDDGYGNNLIEFQDVVLDANVYDISFDDDTYHGVEKVYEGSGECYYGGYDPDSGEADFSEYPFYIVAYSGGGGVIYCENEGHPDITISTPDQEVITTTEDFRSAVNSVVSGGITIGSTTLTEANLIRLLALLS